MARAHSAHSRVIGTVGRLPADRRAFPLDVTLFFTVLLHTNAILRFLR